MLRGMLKKLLPKFLINALLRFSSRLDISVALFASRNGWLSWMYYGLFSNLFRREMQTVLKARVRYSRAASGDSPTSYLLRRNIHRLEKGLIMRPRREVFAEGYIGETVDYLMTCIAADVLLESEREWVFDVMAEYFNAVSKTTTTVKAQTAFAAVNTGLHRSGVVGKKPMIHDELPGNPVSFEDLKRLCGRRHSVRWFQDKQVPRALIEAAVEVAFTAPSACNRQAFNFYIFDDPFRAQAIGAIPMGTAGFSDNFQCVVVVVGDLSAYPHEKDRHIIYIDSALATMQFQLALETLGLSSCAINWPDIERHERQMSEELNLAEYQRPTLLIALGYAESDALVPYSAKKTADDVSVWPQ